MFHLPKVSAFYFLISLFFKIGLIDCHVKIVKIGPAEWRDG